MSKRIFKIDQELQIAEEKLKNQKEPKTKAKELKTVANYLNIGWYLVIPILLGVLLGVYLDRLFDTKPIFVLLLTLLGAASSFYNLWRLIQD